MTAAETTDSKVKFILDTLDAAGVSMTDFAKLTAISRTTLYAWRRGANVADKLRLQVAFNYAIRLDRAVEGSRLPLIDKLSPPQRLKVLRQIIAETNREMRG
jgi:transcriptional regulator with XRE-family HTH domain